MAIVALAARALIMFAQAPWRRRPLIGALVVGAGLASFALTAAFLAESRGSRDHSNDVVRRPQPGTEVLAIFVASSTCGASAFPGLRAALRDIRRVLREEAVRDGKLLVSIGVSLDPDPWEGVTFLKQFGPFDEILAGGSWLNTGSIAFIVRDFPGRREIPQLILVERDVTMSERGIAEVSDRLVGRKIGGDGIVRFAHGLAAASGSEDGRYRTR